MGSKQFGDVIASSNYSVTVEWNDAADHLDLYSYDANTWSDYSSISQLKHKDPAARPESHHGDPVDVASGAQTLHHGFLVTVLIDLTVAVELYVPLI